MAISVSCCEGGAISGASACERIASAENALLMRSSSDFSDRRMRITNPENSMRTPRPAPPPIRGTAFCSQKDLSGGGVVVEMTSGVVVGVGVVVVVEVVGARVVVEEEVVMT